MQTMDKDLKHSGITKEVGEERQDAVMGLILHKKKLWSSWNCSRKEMVFKKDWRHKYQTAEWPFGRPFS